MGSGMKGNSVQNASVRHYVPAPEMTIRQELAPADGADTVTLQLCPLIFEYWVFWSWVILSPQIRLLL